MFVVKSPYIYPQPTEITKNYYPFIDLDFIQGKNPFDSFLTVEDKKLWYPTCHRQIKTINAFCSSGPYVPKLSNDRDSTWELPINYTFHFKWGGPQLQDQPVSNPKTKDTYPVPDTIKEAIQIHDPSKNIAATMFHQWDYRRGCITSSAIKRMSENLETDSSISSDAESTPKRKGEYSHSSTTQKKRHKKSPNVSSHSAKKLHAKKRKHHKTSSSSSTSNSSSSSSSSTTS